MRLQRGFFIKPSPGERWIFGRKPKRRMRVKISIYLLKNPPSVTFGDGSSSGALITLLQILQKSGGYDMIKPLFKDVFSPFYFAPKGGAFNGI